MAWTSMQTSFATFKAAISDNPGQIFLAGRLYGKQTQLTLETILEEMRSIQVRGVGWSWSAIVKKKGGKISAFEIKLAQPTRRRPTAKRA